MKPQPIDYLAGFPLEVRTRAYLLREQGVLLERVMNAYPDTHEIQSNGALYAYTQDLKRQHLKSSRPLGKVRYHDKLRVLHQALGLHTYAVRVQGSKLKSSNEIKIAGLFRELPPEFLRMVVLHELAHLRHKDHDKAFYRLCCHMEPEYHRYESDLRMLLFARQSQGA